MNGNNLSNGSRSSGELPEKLNLTQARKFLGISFAKMTALISSGILPFEEDPLDGRVKLVRRVDLEALRQRSYV
jgi:hypothetical protein